LTIKYLRRESFSIYPTSLVKDRDHRGSKSAPDPGTLFHPCCGLNHRVLPGTLPTFPDGRRFASRQVGGAERNRTAGASLRSGPFAALP
jgi:hypothetical protein